MRPVPNSHVGRVRCNIRGMVRCSTAPAGSQELPVRFAAKLRLEDGVRTFV